MGSENRIKTAEFRMRIEPDLLAEAVKKVGGKDALQAAMRAALHRLSATDGSADPVTALTKKLNDVAFILDREATDRHAQEAKTQEQIEQIKRLGAIIAKNDIERKKEIEALIKAQTEIVKTVTNASADANKTASGIAQLTQSIGAVVVASARIEELATRFSAVMDGLAAAAEGER